MLPINVSVSIPYIPVFPVPWDILTREGCPVCREPIRKYTEANKWYFDGCKGPLHFRYGIDGKFNVVEQELFIDSKYKLSYIQVRRTSSDPIEMSYWTEKGWQREFASDAHSFEIDIYNREDVIDFFQTLQIFG
jgi:hypothetical protein